MELIFFNQVKVSTQFKFATMGEFEREKYSGDASDLVENLKKKKKKKKKKQLKYGRVKFKIKKRKTNRI